MVRCKRPRACSVCFTDLLFVLIGGGDKVFNGRKWHLSHKLNKLGHKRVQLCRSRAYFLTYRITKHLVWNTTGVWHCPLGDDEYNECDKCDSQAEKWDTSIRLLCCVSAEGRWIIDILHRRVLTMSSGSLSRRARRGRGVKCIQKTLNYDV